MNIFTWILVGIMVVGIIFFIFVVGAAISCCMLSSKISQAEENLKNSKN